MSYSRLLVLAISIIGHFLSNITFAAAIQFYELGAPVIGTAGVGQAALANDASTAYFNPAGMMQLSNSQYLAGAQMMLPEVHFEKNNHNTISGDNGGNAGALVPGAGMYYVNSDFEKITWGISFTSPYGGLLNYNDGWAGRFAVQTTQLYALDLNPVIAYQLFDWLALGAGISIEYANLSQTVALPIEPLIDGQINIKVSDFSPGFNIGLLWTPFDETKIGIAYRSQIVHDMTGDITFLRLNITPQATAKMTMPNNIIISGVQQITDNLNLLGEIGWSEWSCMKETILTVDGLSAITQLDWNNTYRLGIAAQYNLTPALLVQAGVSYDSSPAVAKHRQPELPMDKQYRFGAGIIYAPIEGVDVGFSYEYIDLGKAIINSISSDGILAGSYRRNYINLIQTSINVYM